MKRIIVTTDVHGHFSNYNYATKKEENWGLTSINQEIKKLKTKDTILIDNGDFFQGSALMNHYFRFHQFDNPSIKIFNYMEYDYYNLGNHDFNFGKKELLNFLTKIKAKTITTNVQIDDIKFNYQIHEFSDGTRACLIGVVTDFVKIWEQEKNLEGIKITNAYNTLKEQIKKVKTKENVDYIIGIYHGGIEKDIETKKANRPITGENEGYKMCEDLELDILITGHEHREIVGICENVLVTQSNYRGLSYIQIDLEPEKKAILNYPQKDIDEKINELIKEENQIVNNWLDQEIKKTKIDLAINDPYEARINKHSFFSLINKIIQSKIDCDLSSVGLDVNAKGFSNNITIREILASFPFENTLVVYETTGKVLKKYLEHSLEFFIVKDNKIIINPDKINPKNELYNYEMVGGIDYYANISQKPQERIIKILYNNKEIKDTDKFKICMTNYRASKTGGYNMIDEMKFIKEYQVDIVDLIIDYLENNDINEGLKSNIHLTIEEE